MANITKILDKMLGSKEIGNIHFWGGHEKMFYKDDI